MSKIMDITKQISQHKISLAIGLSFSILVITSVIILGIFTDKEFTELTRDPAATNGTSILIGFVSNLGIMVWSAATTLCFFGYFMSKKTHHHSHYGNFLLSSGCLSLFLDLDDTFMLHETVIPKFLHIPEKLLYVVYFAIVFYYLYSNYRQIIKTNYIIMIVSLCFLGMSLMMDRIMSFGNIETLLEDGFKFCGIVFWLIYFYTVDINIIREIASKQTDESSVT